ncbi:two-component system histidine kinase PnpS [Aquibacillus salsiterrae]|uniref:histidine kinase n=1 Tax=Aquibacillus salsiterrae TaxID=2950439 RepID=A0A9X3WAM4_9BACI|nr:ATP-binding protein [Aquibacillus salsiterrae]MDC3415742.1 cell wall metabolism sensor histidine kinase WalK [Aquibacillus salsiterrae]
MLSINSRLLYTYVVIIITVILIIGIIILPLLDGYDRILGGLALLGGLIVIWVMIFNIFEKYIKPVRAAANVASELAKGNYKVRTYDSYYGDGAKLGHSINILARSLQEMAVQEKIHSNQLRTVIDNMESGLILIDDRGYINLVNRKFINMFGKEFKDYIGYLYYDVLDQTSIHSAVQEAFLYEEKVENSIAISMEYDKRYFEIVGAPVINDQHVLKGVILVFHDITKLKRVEQMRKDFVANVSHELKTPITSIKGFAETLLEGAKDDEQLSDQFLTIILTESERLQALVHDLLELSKLDQDEMKLKSATILFPEFINNIAPIIQQEAERKKITLEMTVDQQASIVGDSDRLKQVLLNLLHNAINYTPANGMVQLSVKSVSEAVIIEVADTGIGIPEDFQSRIFERFFRVDRARSRNTGGTGLGLAIVKRIVEAHHGTIHVKSKLNQGSTFEIRLPKKKIF